MSAVSTSSKADPDNASTNACCIRSKVSACGRCSQTTMESDNCDNRDGGKVMEGDEDEEGVDDDSGSDVTTVGSESLHENADCRNLS